MKVQKKQSSFVLHQGDCLNILRTIPDNSIDSVVTDPPYGLSFMGKRWDYDVPSVDIWAECLRVLKPGGHLLAFAGTRTQHRMAVRIEDAGFEIRDMIAWVYGSGFPKSLDVSKAIDKAAGAEREVVGTKAGMPGYSLNQCANHGGVAMQGNVDGSLRNPEKECAITAPATEAARQWQGWGTALKPALEPITVARKPLAGTVADNVLAHGTGALNIDGCRVGTDTVTTHSRGAATSFAKRPGENTVEESGRVAPQNRPEFVGNARAGRWPANLIHDSSEEVLAGFPDTKGGVAVRRNSGGNTFGGDKAKPSMDDLGYGDAGSAARFFYCAKASKKDRGDGNNHPTVKPTELMRYLCRLVTPPGGTVLDPFMGSGSTGKAAGLENFSFVGIEKEQSYVEIAEKRIKAVYDLESDSESTKDDNVAD